MSRRVLHPDHGLSRATSTPNRRSNGSEPLDRPRPAIMVRVVGGRLDTTRTKNRCRMRLQGVVHPSSVHRPTDPAVRAPKRALRTRDPSRYLAVRRPKRMATDIAVRRPMCTATDLAERLQSQFGRTHRIVDASSCRGPSARASEKRDCVNAIRRVAPAQPRFVRSRRTS